MRRCCVDSGRSLRGARRRHDTGRGLPGLRGPTTSGSPSRTWSRRSRFFVEVLGCERFYDLGPFQSDGDWMQTHLAVHPRAVMRKLKLLRCGHGSNFEIFEYEAPDQRREQPRNSDIGGHHLAFYVDDLDAALSHLLRARGARSSASRPGARARAPVRPGSTS